MPFKIIVKDVLLSIHLGAVNETVVAVEDIVPIALVFNVPQTLERLPLVIPVKLNPAGKVIVIVLPTATKLFCDALPPETTEFWAVRVIFEELPAQVLLTETEVQVPG